MGIPILNYTFFLWAGKLVDSLITMKLHVIESAKWVMSHLFVISFGDMSHDDTPVSPTRISPKTNGILLLGGNGPSHDGHDHIPFD